MQKPVFYENKEPSPKIVIKKITPPVLRVLVNENHQKYEEEEEEIDAYEEINKQWKCIIL